MHVPTTGREAGRRLARRPVAAAALTVGLLAGSGLAGAAVPGGTAAYAQATGPEAAAAAPEPVAPTSTTTVAVRPDASTKNLPLFVQLSLGGFAVAGAIVAWRVISTRD